MRQSYLAHFSCFRMPMLMFQFFSNVNANDSNVFETVSVTFICYYLEFASLWQSNKQNPIQSNEEDMYNDNWLDLGIEKRKLYIVTTASVIHDCCWWMRSFYMCFVARTVYEFWEQKVKSAIEHLLTNILSWKRFFAIDLTFIWFVTL